MPLPPAPEPGVLNDCWDGIEAGIHGLNTDTVRRAYVNDRRPLPQMLVHHEQRELQITMNEATGSSAPAPGSSRRRM